MRGDLTVIVPAYNEAETLGDTIRSLQAQTLPPEEIVVVDDCSEDGTGEVARNLGVRVVRPPRNTGSKAGAQTFALREVRTGLVAAVDADTVLAPDALARLLPAFSDPELAAVCGFVLPRRVRTIWERGRYVEYLFAFSFVKQVQDYYRRPLISSGCFSAYRTGVLREMGGWSDRTMAEDMDLTWNLYQAGWGVRFVPEAVCYPIEPHEARRRPGSRPRADRQRPREHAPAHRRPRPRDARAPDPRALPGPDAAPDPAPGEAGQPGTKDSRRVVPGACSHATRP